MITNDINNQLIYLSILIVILVFFVYTRAFKNDVPTCNGYKTNVYLYIVLALLILAFCVLFIEKRRFAITQTKSLLAFIVSMFLIFLLYLINARNVIANHLIWILYIISISVSIYSFWKYSKNRGLLINTLIVTLLLVIILTTISLMFPDLIDLNWGNTLIVALLTGIFAWTIPMILGYQNINFYYKFLSAIFVFIFMILILYDTQLLKVKAEYCTKLGIPDYPKDSLGMFLNTLNLFTNLTNIGY